ncbi:MAG: endonuclease III [Clostridia bacterium]
MRQRTVEILSRLEKLYLNPKSELKFKNNFELIVSVILSAQCTDKRVNLVTPKLFEIAPNPYVLSTMPINELEKMIFPCGFYRMKSKHLHEMSCQLVEKFNGEVPDDFDVLQTLSGVGRKTANVVCAVGFNKDAIAVDTHVYRVSHRLGLAQSKDVLKTELELQESIDKTMWSKSHHLLLLFGRYVCKSQTPKCKECTLYDLCEYNAKTHKNDV